MPKYCYINGKIKPLAKAAVSPYDLGFLRGYGVFDVMKAVNGKPFLINEHWSRFRNSARELDLKIPLDVRRYKETVKKLIRLNKVKSGYIIRTVITGGVSSDGLTPEGKETFYVATDKLKPLKKEAYEKGTKVITLEFQREFPASKVNNYVMAIKNIKRKKKEGAHEILYVNQGKVKEGALSNFFIVKNGKFVTPKENILIGVTRNLVIKLARQSRIEISERDVLLKELYSAREIFLTNTTKGIVPVVKVNNKKIGSGKVGEITKVLMEKLKEYMKNY